MSKLKLPLSLSNNVEAHNKWLNILNQAQKTVEEDAEQQQLIAKGIRFKERSLPPEIVGRNYARYCDLINKIYDAYLNSVHLQRAPYMLEIITVFVKRMYELRNELVHMIVNDYIYVDSALAQLRMTPLDIQIVVPFHFPLESRSDNVEKVLQKMWADAVKRKRRREAPPKPKPPPQIIRESKLAMDFVTQPEEEVSDEETESPPSSVHTFVPEEYIQSLVIQRHERFRQWRIRDIKAQIAKRKMYFLDAAGEEAPEEIKQKAAELIRKVYREYMKIKRERVKEAKRDMLLGIIPDPFRSGPSYKEENNKVYERRRKTRLKIKRTYLKELEKENQRLIVFKKGEHFEDITDEIRNWFKEWFYGYHYFPEFPYEVEGGTILVVRGDFITIDEKKQEDEKLLTQTKGKTKDQLKEERARAKEEAKMKADALKEAKKKEEELAMKMKCNPFTDPGYKLKESEVMQQLIEALRNYRVSWSIYDELPSDRYGDAIYGYLKPLLTEDLMQAIHLDCRKFVDEMMRLDLKMLIQKHQLDFKSVGWKYPKLKPRKKPKILPVPNTSIMDQTLLKNTEPIFDIGIVTKPKAKISDILGDSSYAAYNYNIRDPNASFPLPGYGDIKDRLVLSCVMGTGIQPGAPRRKAVMLLGPPRNGKSFLADTVAGELNAVKIDISPEVFSAVIQKPVKALSQVFVIARAFQPAVVFLKDIERVFATKVQPEDKYLKASGLKAVLAKLVKQISEDDKVIFIATCSNPWAARVKLMLKLFDEIILVPRTDYGTLQQFYYERLQSIKSMPRDYSVQPIAQLMQGFSFGDIIEAYYEVMTPERIVKLNAEPLSPGEFLDVFLRKDLEPLTLEDYQRYVDFYIQNSPLKGEREDYARINFFRDDMYKKEAKKKKAEKAEAQ